MFSFHVLSLAVYLQKQKLHQNFGSFSSLTTYCLRSQQQFVYINECISSHLVFRGSPINNVYKCSSLVQCWRTRAAFFHIGTVHRIPGMYKNCSSVLRPVPGMYKNCCTCVEARPGTYKNGCTCVEAHPWYIENCCTIVRSVLVYIRTVAPVLRPMPGICRPVARY